MNYATPTSMVVTDFPLADKPDIEQLQCPFKDQQFNIRRTTVGEEAVLTLIEHDVKREFRSVNTRKATGPDEVSSCSKTPSLPLCLLLRTPCSRCIAPKDPASPACSTSLSPTEIM